MNVTGPVEQERHTLNLHEMHLKCPSVGLHPLVHSLHCMSVDSSLGKIIFNFFPQAPAPNTFVHDTLLNINFSADFQS